MLTSNLKGEDALKAHFRPEFLNRLDEVLEYRPLEREEIHSIVDVQLARLAKQLEEKEIAIELSDAAKQSLSDEGFDPEYGARPLKRVIQRRLQNKLADAILAGELNAGDTARFDFGEHGYTLQVVHAVRSEPAAVA